MVQLIILRGYPGSGKTTIGKVLEKQGIGKFVDHNAILTFIANIAGDDNGIYDDIANLEKAITGKLLSAGKTVIVARGFSSLKSLVPYVQLAESLEVPTTVIRLNVDLEELTQRVTSPERKADFNPTINEENLTKWINANPIIDYPNEVIVDNSQPIDKVVNSILTQI